MSREIKFRAMVDNDLNEWTYGYYLPDGNGKHYIHNSTGQLRVRPDTLGQYTGLKDKNGVEIYEGDIVKVEDDDPGIVVEYKQGAGFIGFYPGLGGMEVIGNIYENKELLK